MDFEDLKKLYLERSKRDPIAYRDISAILEELKPLHKQDFLLRNPGSDQHGQSWRSWKGNNFEKLADFVVSDLIERELGLKTVRGSSLRSENLSEEMLRVKQNILVDFEEHGGFIPDADIVVYSPSDLSVKAIISCKVTLRERIAQTGYWKIKLGRVNTSVWICATLSAWKSQNLNTNA